MKKQNVRIISILLIAFILAACGPSVEKIGAKMIKTVDGYQTEVAETSTALATKTPGEDCTITLQVGQNNVVRTIKSGETHTFFIARSVAESALTGTPGYKVIYSCNDGSPLKKLQQDIFHDEWISIQNQCAENKSFGNNFGAETQFPFECIDYPNPPPDKTPDSE